MEKDPVDAALSGRTISGKPINLELAALKGQLVDGVPIDLTRAASESWIRRALDTVSSRLAICAMSDHGDDTRSAMFLKLLKALRKESTRPSRYTELGLTFAERESGRGVPEPYLDCFDAVVFGLDRAGGLEAFSKAAKLPNAVSVGDLFCAAGFLLVDDCVTAIERDDLSIAAWLLFHAYECEDTFRWEQNAGEVDDARSTALTDYFRKRNSLAGKASGRKRQRKAKAKLPAVVAAYDAEVRIGTEQRAIVSRLAGRFGVSTTHIRKLLVDRLPKKK